MKRYAVRTAAVAGIGMLVMANAVFAAPSQTIPKPVPIGEAVFAAPEVSLPEAAATVEKAYEARSTSARLRYGHGSPAWQIRLLKENGERLLVWVDAKNGEIISANTLGKRKHHRRVDEDDRCGDGERHGWHDDCRD